jgi:hypothetical protein
MVVIAIKLEEQPVFEQNFRHDVVDRANEALPSQRRGETINSADRLDLGMPWN